MKPTDLKTTKTLKEFQKIEELQTFDNLKPEPGVLYISHEYQTSSHLCPCGCGAEIIIPFNHPMCWDMTMKDGKVTFNPSLLNPCGAHYFVRDNKIIWV